MDYKWDKIMLKLCPKHLYALVENNINTDKDYGNTRKNALT
jgi:hypothetical protein